MSQKPIIIVVEKNQIDAQNQPSIMVVIQVNQITIEGNIPMNFQSFSFTCTLQGQKIFGPLPYTPQAIWLYITGAAQNQADGDFEISDLIITTSQGCNLGDTIYGVIQL